MTFVLEFLFWIYCFSLWFIAFGLYFKEIDKKIAFALFTSLSFTFVSLGPTSDAFPIKSLMPFFFWSVLFAFSFSITSYVPFFIKMYCSYGMGVISLIVLVLMFLTPIESKLLLNDGDIINFSVLVVPLLIGSSLFVLKRSERNLIRGIV